MSQPAPPALDYKPVEPADRGWALARLMQSDAAPEQLTDEQVAAYAHRLGVDYRHLWAGHAEGRAVGPVALFVLRPGRTAMLFASTPLRRTDIQPLAGAIRSAGASIAAKQATMAQALVEPTESLMIDAMLAAGFVDLATLEYMQRSVPRQGRESGLGRDIEVVHYERSRRADFIAALEASYEQTLDCPMLRGLRQMDDVLDGHMATGRFDPALWTLLYTEGRPIGVQLLAPIEEQQCVELVYLGLAPEARGRGLATGLIELAFDQCRALSLNVMTLAVDMQNTPALALYRRSGFYRVARRRALIKELHPVRDAPLSDC